MTTTSQEQSVFDQIGGTPAVTAVVTRFYDLVLADPDLAPFFTHVDMRRQHTHLRAFVAAALGGPEPWVGRGMKDAHAAHAITDAHFDAVVGHLVTALTELEVDPSHIATIGGALAPLRDEIVSA